MMKSADDNRSKYYAAATADAIAKALSASANGVNKANNSEKRAFHFFVINFPDEIQ